jgi:hypothetical protein
MTFLIYNRLSEIRNAVAAKAELGRELSKKLHNQEFLYLSLQQVH